MALLIQEGQVTVLDPSYSGRWTGACDGASGEPDQCYFCGIGDRLPAVGMVKSAETHYGVCEHHKRRRVEPGKFVRYKAKAQTVTLTARQVRPGMDLVVDLYANGNPHLRRVTKVTRPLKGLLRVYFLSTYMAVTPEHTFTQLLPRFRRDNP